MKYDGLYKLYRAAESTHKTDLDAAKSSSFQAGKDSSAAALMAAKQDLEAALKAKDEAEQNFSQAAESVSVLKAQAVEAAEQAATARAKHTAAEFQITKMAADHAAAIKRLEEEYAEASRLKDESHSAALSQAADLAVANFQKSRDFFLVNNKAYLRGFQELRHRVIKNFPESKDQIMSWGFGDAEHDLCVAELRAAAEIARKQAEEAAASDYGTETATDDDEGDDRDDAAS